MTPGPIQKTFQLDPSILDPKSSAARIEISTGSDADVVAAILGNDPLPLREISFGAINLGASASSITMKAGPGTVGVQASAGTRTGLSVCNSATAAINSLQLETPPELQLQIGGAATDRYLCGVFRYNASGNFTAAQAVGAIGTLKFGAKASSAGLLAVIHRFAPQTPSQQALGDTFASFRLPRHVSNAGTLAPGTWIVGETEGSLALQIAASLGYDVNFARKLNLLNITRELSAKIDASVKATFGFSVSGKYLVVVSRADATNNVRLQLFKQAQNGMTFGLNAGVGLQFAPTLPQNPDDLVKTIFGVHGLQVMKDLEEWIEPTADLGALAARLGISEAKELIRSVAGVDPDAELVRGHKMLMDAIAQWKALPGTSSAEIWKLLAKLSPEEALSFEQALAALADPDPAKSAAALTAILENATFGATPEGQFLAAIAAGGVLALGANIPDVQKTAGQALDVLKGGALAKLQTFIDGKLDLQKLLDASDPAQIDSWLEKRLADFFDGPLLPPLKEVQTAVRRVMAYAQSIYATALKTATNGFSAQLAATYQRTVTGGALADVVFDTAKPEAAALLQRILESGSLDTLFTTPAAGVSVRQASISHEIRRAATIQVHLPYFDSKTEHINDSVASLTVEHDAGNVLVYQLQASDKVRKKRCLSQMQVFARVAGGRVAPGATIAYQTLLAKPKMTRQELVFRTEPFLTEYLSSLFTGPSASIDTFYAGLDRTVEDVLHNGPNEFGNVLLNMQVALPASILQAWVDPLTPDQLHQATMEMSLALQSRLREVVPLLYFQNLDHLVANPIAAALLVWSAFPLSTSIGYDFESKQIHQLDTRKDVYWDWRDPGLRNAMASLPATQATLGRLLATAQRRLQEAGRAADARNFDPKRAADFQSMAISEGGGSSRLSALTMVESTLVRKAAAALDSIQKAGAAAKSDPSVAIVALADAGAALTETFNGTLSGIYGGDASRPLNSMLLVEATKAIAATAGAMVDPKGMLSLIVLHENSSYDGTKFIGGDMPADTEIALKQSLVGG